MAALKSALRLPLDPTLKSCDYRDSVLTVKYQFSAAIDNLLASFPDYVGRGADYTIGFRSAEEVGRYATRASPRHHRLFDASHLMRFELQ